MGPAEQLLGALGLITWFGLWWTAVRAVSGAWLGLSRCASVVALAYLVPLLGSDLLAVRAPHFGLPFLAAWGGIALAIGGVWAARRACSWYRTRRAHKQAEPGAAPDRC